MKPEEFMQGTVYKNPQGDERKVLALGVDKDGYAGFFSDDGDLYICIMNRDVSYMSHCTLVSQPYATPVKMFPQRKVYCWDDDKEAKKEGLLVDVYKNHEHPFIVSFEDGSCIVFKNIEEIPPEEPEITISEFQKKHGDKKFKESELLKLLENE